MAEVRIADDAFIAGPVAEVWAAIEDPAAHAEWHPFVTRISGEHRLGAIRSCSVQVGTKSGETRERCVEHEQERRIVWQVEEDSTGFGRLVADWHAGFTVEPVDGGTRVTAESVYRPRSVLVRLMRPIVARKFHHAQRAILAGLGQAIDQGGRAPRD